MRTCEVEGCESPVVGQGLCREHYARKRRKGTTDDTRKNARGICSVDDCSEPHQALGLCYAHWKSQRTKAQRLQRKVKESRRCGSCGNPVDPSRRYRGPVSYCSRTCKEKAWVAGGGNRVAALKWYYKDRYGLTQEEVAALLVSQGGGCAICGTTDPKGRHSGFHVDHDHATGVVRGILCHGCNVSLGHFRDHVDLLEAAIAYLKRNSQPL
jgi:Autographiviridae endonuclease VII